MELWTNGETYNVGGDPAERSAAFREARKAVESAINAAVQSREYGDGLAKLAVTHIVMPEDAAEQLGYGERTLVKRAERKTDFRLRVDYDAWDAADAGGKRRLLFANVVRAVDLLGRKRIDDFDVARLRDDVLAVGREHGWA